ncbi:hypothetical protein LOTGIDRAFT_155229 [Lottia gigantea]|uniref:Uncharacterized protein n=1 Tax=Lottia gigantea TaxID=225164 RepID=V3ZSR3_LOTGI|nr:hypothetical protein LOTGIDRAFT_155229 [Lottia gigantea]ESO83926.1 hypothetical protein LOTGIDRAFT_155229 [Lottia gigantea]
MSNEVDSKPVSTMDGEKYLILRTNSTLDLYDSVLTDIERQFIAGYLICIGEVSTKTSRHFNIQTRIILKTHGFEDPNYIAVNAITVTEKTRKNGWDHFVMFITASPTWNSPLLSYSTLDIGKDVINTTIYFPINVTVKCNRIIS